MSGDLRGTIGTPPVHHDHFGSGCLYAQVAKKRADQLPLVKNRNDNGNCWSLHSSRPLRWLTVSLETGPSVKLPARNAPPVTPERPSSKTTKKRAACGR